MTEFKRAAALLLTILLFAAVLPAAGLSEETFDELRVGNPTAMKGDFFTEMFGNDTADIDVRALIHGYNLVSWDQNQGVYLIDESVVESCMVTTNGAGDRYYYLALCDDLYYSDGTPITAWDYAFSRLLMMSPQVEEIGGKIYRAEHILGYDEYITGQRPYLEGVGVIDDHQLVIILDHEFLPYFFEPGLLLCVPYPISVIAPGCRVYADGAESLGDGYGYGVYIGNEDPNETEPRYTAELLRKTILDSETGYNSHPSVTSGPYVLKSFDGKTAHFELNPYFKGAWAYSTLPETFHYEIDGLSGGTRRTSGAAPCLVQVNRTDADGNEKTIWLVKPTIEKISFTVADSDTVADDLRSGRLHLANKIVYGPTIEELIGETQATEGESIQYQDYPRIGLAFLTFDFEQAAVHEKEVRQAIAWCMDREAITEAYTSGHAVVVNGYYGIEQWEYLICTDQIGYPINLAKDDAHRGDDLEKWAGHLNMYAASDEEYAALQAAWKTLSLDNLTAYCVDVDKANAILDGAGWTLNREGGAYDPARDDVRCKMIDGELTALDLTLMVPAGNHIVDTLQENFIDNLNQAGIRLTLVPEEMEELLKAYYREKDRTTDMIYLATNFHVVVDPSITYSTDSTANHLIWNNTYSDDEDLYWRAVNMRRTDPADVYDYVVKWISFQERYNEVLPAIPIYSNIYYDFYNEQLRNYNITAHVTWSQAILQAIWGEDQADSGDFSD